MILLTFPLLIGLTRSEPFKFNGNFEDIFLYTVRNQIDHNVSPCNNFYAHACPTTTKYTVSQYSNAIARYMIDEGIKLGTTLNTSYIENLYESMISQMEADHISTAVFGLVFPDYPRVAKNMRKAIYMLRYMDHHNIHTPQEYQFFENLKDRLLWITDRELHITHEDKNESWYTESLISILRDTTASIGLQKEKFSTSDYEKLQGLIDDIFFHHFRLHKMNLISKYDVVERRNEFKDILIGIIGPVMASLGAFEGTLAAQINSFQFNSFNSDGHLNILEQYILPARNTSKAAKYGYIGQVLGHELMHSFFTNSTLERNPLIGEKALCSLRHVHRIRKEFYHDNDDDGVHRYMEDTADHEGGKIAYKLFLDEFGDKINDPIVPGMNISTHQMFFYALSAGDCNPLEKEQSTDKHSMGLIRVNGAVSLIQGFHKAFGCKSGDRMMDVAEDETCNLLGTPAR